MLKTIALKFVAGFLFLLPGGTRCAKSNKKILSIIFVVENIKKRKKEGEIYYKSLIFPALFSNMKNYFDRTFHSPSATYKMFSMYYPM